ncbi:MAG: thioredoxin fold domain-containing protein [Planctomycetota bacterium]|jgi:hypothetical protein
MATALLLVAAGAGFSWAGEGEDGPEPVTWVISTDKAKSMAREGGKLILAHIRAGDCKWCRKVETETHPVPAVMRVLNSVVPLWLDVRGKGKVQGRKLLRRAGLRGVPASLILDGELKVILAVGGYKSSEAFVEEVGGGLEAYEVFTKRGPEVEAGEGGYAVLCEFVKACSILGKSAEVKEHAPRALEAGEGKGEHDLATAFYLARALGPGDGEYSAAKARVLRLDPDNASGYFDDLVIDEAVSVAKGGRSIGKKPAGVERARAILEARLAMEKPAPKLDRAQTMYWVLFQLWCQGESADPAMARSMLHKGIDLDPKSTLGRRMAKALKELKE